jgi:transposase
MAHPIKSIPGIGSITGPLIVAELGDLRRFASRHPLRALLAYAGMDLRIRKSGQWSGKIKMSKRGSVVLRTAQTVGVGCRVTPVSKRPVNSDTRSPAAKPR